MTESINQMIDILTKRKSVREYTDAPITTETKTRIINAALRAPTAGNMMLYTILDITDQKLKDELAMSCDDQPFIATAPMVLVFLADYQRWMDYFNASGVSQLCAQNNESMRPPGDGDLLLACCDALIAAQTAVIAADALGLGSCYIGDILEQYEFHKKLFNLPQFAIPICMLCFGYPTEAQQNREQPRRFDSKFIVHENQYQQFQPDQFEEMFSWRHRQLFSKKTEINGAVNVGQVMYRRKFSADYALEMNRSVSAMLKAWNRQD